VILVGGVTASEDEQGEPCDRKEGE